MRLTTRENTVSKQTTQTFNLTGMPLSSMVIRRLFKRFPSTTLIMTARDKLGDESFVKSITFSAGPGEFAEIRNALEVLGVRVSTPHEDTSRNERFARGLDWGNR